ncbi:hypothetical protein T484DRAFT_1643684 [Baffinella frigidus]|nr:hypothetical protein T484DRAFT_1643684 [Cryptophyta sp. CCMP2293]
MLYRSFLQRTVSSRVVHITSRSLRRGWLEHLHPSPFTLHPSPQTLNPKPFTLNPSP